jgi:uncharacterized membrane protein
VIVFIVCGLVLLLSPLIAEGQDTGIAPFSGVALIIAGIFGLYLGYSFWPEMRGL